MGVIFRDWQQTATAEGSPTPIPSSQVVGRRYSLRNFGARGADTFEDAVDCTAAIVLALNSGLPLTGDGKWYGVSGNIERNTGFSLWDAKFKQLNFSGNDGRKTLYITGGSGYDLRRITVHRNGTPADGSDASGEAILGGAGGIYCINSANIVIEECEITGDGHGFGIAVVNCDDSVVTRCFIHDMMWSLGDTPPHEQLGGIRCSDNNNCQFTFNRIGNLTGTIPWSAGKIIDTTDGRQWRTNAGNSYRATNTGTTGAPGPDHSSGTFADGGGVSWEYMGPETTVRCYNTDGIGVGGSTNCVLLCNDIWGVWQGVNVNGGDPNKNIQLIGNNYRDIDAFGEKWVHTTFDSGSIGSRAWRCGSAGFIAAGEPGPKKGCERLTITDFKAFDTGSNGNWPALGGVGFKVADAQVANYNSAKQIRFIGCLAVDEQVATCTITIATPGVITKVAHGKSIGDKVHFVSTGALPTGLAENTLYYVNTVPTADTFTVSLIPASEGGLPIDTTGSQSGTHSVTMPTMTYGFLNDAPNADSALISECYVSGDAVALGRDFSGFGLSRLGAGYNHCFNGAFDVWQEKTSYTVPNGVATYVADGFKSYRGAAGMTISRQAGFSGSRYCLRMQRDSGNSATNALIISWQIPSARCYELAGKTLIVSADIRVGANYSGTAATFSGVSGTGVDEVFNIGGATFATGSALGNLGTSGALTPGGPARRVTFKPYVVPVSATEIAFRLACSQAGTAGAADYLEVTNIKVEVGGVPTLFEQEDPAITLARARRRYRKSFLAGTVPAQNVGVGTGEEKANSAIAGAVSGFFGIRWDDEMAATPTITLYNPAASNAQVRNITDGADCSSTASANVTTRGFDITFTGTAGTAVGEQLGVHYVADARL